MHWGVHEPDESSREPEALGAESRGFLRLLRCPFRGSAQVPDAAHLRCDFKKGAAEQRALRRLGLERPELDLETEQQIERLASLDEVRTALRTELNELSPARREALQLRVIDELPYREVARRLEISEAAARARVSRALRELAVALNQNSIIEEVT
ncbi:MAG: RNA polymerase sigma factor [Actinomycetota bacterium]